MCRGISLVVALLACLLIAPGHARAAACGLPDTAPWWIDFADGTVSFRNELAQPGVIVATNGTTVPQAFRRQGAETIYWEMHFESDVGTPAAPASADAVGPAADALFDRAVASSGCDTPVIALNEMQGVTAPTPLAAGAAQYRQNVLAFAQALAARGALPFVLLASSPNTAGDAAAWWRSLAGVAYLVREAYVAAPKIVAQGPYLGSRTLRVTYRTAVTKLTAIGIPADRVGLMLGFQSGGSVGRGGLQPLASWLEFVKLATLAAQQVSGELDVGSVWAWGWGTLTPAGRDPDKAAAACVELWTRNPALCDAPSTAAFDTSVTAGQLSTIPAFAQCVVGGLPMPAAQLAQAERLLGSRQAAYTAMLERLAATPLVPVGRAEERTAEQQLFPDRARLLEGLRVSGVTIGFLRGVIVDQLRYSRLSPEELLAAEQQALATTVCRDDQLPTVGDVRLAAALPLLSGSTAQTAQGRT